MKYKLVKVILACLMVIGVFSATAMAQVPVSTGDISRSPDKMKALQLYKDALFHTDMPNADCDLHIDINTPVGNAVVTGDVKYQKNPFLMKTVLNTAVVSAASQALPNFTITEYVEIAGNSMQVYYTTSDKKAEKKEWHMTKVPLSEALKEQLQLSATDEKYIQAIQENLDTIKDINVENENDYTERLKVVFDSKKVFSSKRLTELGDIGPAADRQKTIELLCGLFESLQSSSDLTGYVEIDKKSHRIVAMDFDLSDQARSSIKYLMEALSAKKDAPETPATADGNVNAALVNGLSAGDAAIIQGIINNVTVNISMKIKPLDDVTHLAVPQKVRDTAKEDKLPVKPKNK